MKISKIEIFLLNKKLSSTMRISRGGFTERFHTLVRVHTDEGLTGLGEGVGNAHAIFGILERYICKKALGLDPTRIEEIRASLIDSHVYYERKGSAICATSAIEMACWDILGKFNRKPVHQLLGNANMTSLETYVSDIYLDHPKAMAEYAQKILDRGFQNFKIHIGSGTLSEDTKRIEAIRKLIGPHRKLMVDLNCGYTPSKAQEALKEWKNFELYWLEEPVNPNLVNEMSLLRAQSSIPIAAGENEFLTFGFQELIEKKAVDVLMPDLGRAGGLQECLNISKLAKQNNIRTSPHNFSSGVLLAATIQFMASNPSSHLLEFDSSKNSIYEELLETELKVESGQIEVPQGPGLGVELKEVTLQKYLIESKTIEN